MDGQFDMENQEYSAIPIIFRKNKENDIIAFFPSMECNIGIISCYSRKNGSGVATIEYYRGTKRADSAEYADLLKELKEIYNGNKIVVKKRLR